MINKELIKRMSVQAISQYIKRKGNRDNDKGEQIAFVYLKKDKDIWGFMAIPPSVTGAVRDALFEIEKRLEFLDFHVACGDSYQFISENLDCVYEYNFMAGTMDQFLHARRFCYYAATGKLKWTGTDTDLPLSFRTNKEEDQ